MSSYCAIALLAAGESFAQTDRNGTLVVTVVDETGVLPGANVTLAGTKRPPRQRPR